MNSLTRERVRAHVERTLSLAEAEAYLATPVEDDERRAVLELVEWFLRRYPRPLDRLRYVDRAYRVWSNVPVGNQLGPDRVD